MEQIFIDEETGESIVRPLLSRGDKQQQRDENETPVNNAETGEPEIGSDTGVLRRRVPFQVIRFVVRRLVIGLSCDRG